MNVPEFIDHFLQQTAPSAVMILGLGREGWSTYRLLRQHLPKLPIYCLDDAPLASLDQKWQKIFANEPLTQFVTAASLSGIELPATCTVFKTPGIPPENPLLAACERLKCTVSSNTQLFFELVTAYNQQTSEHHQLRTVGITGTKGKSTTTALTGAVLQACGMSSLIGGNIGIPPLDMLEQIPANAQQPLALVLELSCHQLAELTHSPQVAVIQGISAEHLDYYPTVWHYIAAKSAICRFQQSEDTVITSCDQPYSLALACLSQGKHLTYGQDSSATPKSVPIPTELRQLLPELPATIPLPPTPTSHLSTNNEIMVNDSILCSYSDLQLLGTHNQQNVLAAVTVAQALQLPLEGVAQALKDFQPLAHRLQLVAEKNGNKYYNDSLATTPEATKAALESLEDQPIILIAGGHDRHLDFSVLAEALITKPVKALILFPPSGENIVTALYRKNPTHHLLETVYKVQSMPEAVQIAKRLAKPGDTILLSPASASFGTFKDYQDRGDQFKAAVESEE